jgi:hypothetical protein
MPIRRPAPEISPQPALPLRSSKKFKNAAHGLRTELPVSGQIFAQVHMVRLITRRSYIESRIGREQHRNQRFSATNVERWTKPRAACTSDRSSHLLRSRFCALITSSRKER